MISGLQPHGLSVSEIAAETRLHRSHIYRLAAGEVPYPRHQTVEALQRLAERTVTKAAPPARK